MRPEIIAEIGWNHMGDMDLASQMIKAAKDSGADFAKFQTWQVSRLKKGEWDDDGRREIYENAELTKEKHIFLIQECQNYQIQFLSSAFSVEDARLLNKLSIEKIKIPSFEVNNFELLEFCKKNFQVIYISTGTASKKEIIDLKECFTNWDGKLIVMHCVSAYPCESKNINLPRIIHLRDYFENVGFSDHTQGIFSTLSSMNLNPVAIEKHFTINHDLPGRDNKFAILPMEMKKINEYIDTYENSMTDYGLEFQKIETPSRENYRGRFDA
tara:strand:- start:4101 stop:4910 length:810 start_codon:yes stop_codon:yes gene_type:complete